MRISSILLGLFLISSFCVFAQTPAPSTPIDPKLISIATDKTSYKLGEEVKVTVSSRAKEVVRVDSYSALRCFIQEFNNEKNVWSVVPMVSCTCEQDVHCNMTEIHIEPDKPYTFSWMQRTSWCEGEEGKWKAVALGRYRVLCPLSVWSGGVTRPFKVTSGEFVIVD